MARRGPFAGPIDLAGRRAPARHCLVHQCGRGLFEGLDETGALRLRLADGQSRVIHAGDVFLI
jgi:hypothetical protein